MVHDNKLSFLILKDNVWASKPHTLFNFQNFKSEKMRKKFYLKERHNPQFDKPYYVKLGQITKAEAIQHEKSIYGHNIILKYENEDLYNKAITDLITQGYNVK